MRLTRNASRDSYRDVAARMWRRPREFLLSPKEIALFLYALVARVSADKKIRSRTQHVLLYMAII